MTHGGNKVGMKFRIWLKAGAGESFGPGKAELLLKIDELGSLKSAAESMGMSYRKAWERVRRAEEVFGAPLLVKDKGNRGGYSLTEFGTRVVRGYYAWIEELEQLALVKAGEHFPPGVTVSAPKKRPEES